MLGSNQRPLPCEGRFTYLLLFADVQKYLQISMLSLVSCRRCSLLFAWVGVLIGVRLVSSLLVPLRTQLWLYVCLEFAKKKSRRADSYQDEGGRYLNRSRTKRTRSGSSRLPSDPRSSRRWADPTHPSCRDAGKAPKAPRSQGPGRIPSRIPNPPRPPP
jgi:hypothetical protein